MPKWTGIGLYTLKPRETRAERRARDCLRSLLANRDGVRTVSLERNNDGDDFIIDYRDPGDCG